jgi:hypothetical protein
MPLRPISDGQDFHARFSARSRTYHYVLYNHSNPSALLAGRAGWVFRPLDVERMREAAQHLIGTHDFSSFRASGCQANTPIKQMHELNIVRQGDVIVFTIRASAFLHHMVRNIVGSLVYVGIGRNEPDWMAEVLDRTLARRRCADLHARRFVSCYNRLRSEVGTAAGGGSAAALALNRFSSFPRRREPKFVSAASAGRTWIPALRGDDGRFPMSTNPHQNLRHHPRTRPARRRRCRRRRPRFRVLSEEPALHRARAVRGAGSCRAAVRERRRPVRQRQRGAGPGGRGRRADRAAAVPWRRNGGGVRRHRGGGKTPLHAGFRVKPDTSAADLIESEAQYRAASPWFSSLLLDTWVDAYGGAGKVFDWSLIPKELAPRVVLSGGLSVQNVTDAVMRVRPFAVDISSGVEESKGIKDARKIAAFIRRGAGCRCITRYERVTP